MRILTYYGGSGFEGCREHGIFEVQHGENETKRLFNNLTAAQKYYESIDDEKACWDMTVIPELIEGHYWIDSNVKQDSDLLPF